MIPKKVAFHNFGCKVNFSEASSLSRQFREQGYEIVDFRDPADIYVISTCVVTAVAEKKCRAAIRQAHRLNPEGKIAVIGCFPELRKNEIAGLEGVEVVLGHSAKFGLLEEIRKLEAGNGNMKTEAPVKETFIPSWSCGDRTRSFLKIQDGCDYYCAYCTIPLARGHSRSDTIENVIRNVHEIMAAGVMEIILAGVNIGDFGRLNNETFSGLLRELDKIKDLPRIRVSSIEPDLLTEEIISLMASSGKFMPHFHIPLQAGNDHTLKAMKRKYPVSVFASRVEKIRTLMPHACIATDVIAGFPGETDEDFRETMDFLTKTDISYLHVFSYSKREGTLASKMPEKVRDGIIKERSTALHKLSENKKREFYRRNSGMKARVLFESDNSGGWMHGFTENYIKVKTTFNPGFVNRIIPVTLGMPDEEPVFTFTPEK